MNSRVASALAGSALAMSAWIAPAVAAEQIVVANLIIESAEFDAGYAMGPARSAAIADFARQAVGAPVDEDQISPVETTIVAPPVPAVPHTPAVASNEVTGTSSVPAQPSGEQVATVLPEIAPAFRSRSTAAPVKRAVRQAPGERRIVNVSADGSKRRVSMPVPVSIGVFR